MKTHFTEYMGTSVRMRILELFIENRGLKFSVSDVVSETGIEKPIVTREFAQLIHYDFILGKKLYTINESNCVMQHLTKIYDIIIHKAIQEVRD